MAEDFISGALAGQQFQLNQFLIQEAPIKLQQEKMALAISQADFDRRQKMADMLASKPPKQGENPLENATSALTSMANAAIQSGLPEEAAKYIKDAGTIQAQMQDAAYKNWEQAYQKSKMATQLLSGVHDQNSLDKMNDYIELTTGRPSYLKGQKYDPGMIDALREASVKHLDKATEAWKKAQTQTEEVKARAEAELIPLRKTQEEKNIALAERAKKAGGSDGNGLEAKTRHVRSVSEYITDRNSTIDKTLADTLAQSIALDAEYRMNTLGKTWPEAQHDAYIHARDKGLLAGLAPTKDRTGTTWERPAELPPSPDKLQDQKIYNVNGTPQWYDASSKMFYPRGKGPQNSNIDNPEETTDDEEESE